MKTGSLRRYRISAATLAIGLFLIPAVAFAAEGPTPESNAAAINTAWTLLAAFLVFIMQAGFAMVETGFTRAKNAANICLKNVVDFVVGSLGFWAIGFGIMFGVSAGGWIGTNNFFTDISASYEGLGIPILAFFLFQGVFAATAATIISGAIAERAKFFSYMIFSTILTALIYPVAGHWIWNGEGWLAKLGFLDFAGSTVVHSIGGWSALVGIALIGARLGKYGKDGSVNPIPGHSMPLATLGTFILWFGWFGFNPGSTLSATDPNIARIAVNTNLAAAAGAVVALLWSAMRTGKPSVDMTLNGALAGLVGITAPCAFVAPWAAVVIGAVSGILVYYSVLFIDRVLKLDDAVGAVSVHLTCGVWGTLAVGLFHETNGLLLGGGGQQLLTQVIGVVAVGVWTVVTSLIVWGILKAIMGIRVSPEEEVRGLDLEDHGTVAYPDFQATEATLRAQAAGYGTAGGIPQNLIR